MHIIKTNNIEFCNVEIHQKQFTIIIHIALYCCRDGGAEVSGWLWQPGLIWRGWGGACITRTYYDDEMSDKTPNTLLEKFLPPIRGVQPKEGKRGGCANLIGPAARRGGKANQIKWPSKPLSCIINCASGARATQKSMLIGLGVFWRTLKCTAVWDAHLADAGPCQLTALPARTWGKLVSRYKSVWLQWDLGQDRYASASGSPARLWPANKFVLHVEQLVNI